MDRVFETGAAATPPSAPAAPSTGYPTAGSPVGGIPATTPGPWWYHMITAELRGVVLAAGLAPDHTNVSQLALAIQTLITSASSAIPAGSIAYIAMSGAPTGWLKANGAAVSRSAYAALFAAIGTAYGVGDGSTTFNLPDLRGEFIRGWDDGRGVDSGRTLGSAQAASTQDLVALVGKYDNTDGIYMATIAHPFTANTWDGAVVTWQSSNAPSPLASRVEAAGSGETRPRNVALLACIKY